MNNELKKEIRGYYLNNIEELITLVNDMYAYTGNRTLEELIVYPMDEINYSLDNHSLLEVLESIDYENFNPFNRWYTWDYNGNLISLDDEELKDEYESCILEILDVLFTYIENEGLENAINDFYLSDDLIEIINNLLRYSKGVELDRVIYKFRENKSEKTKQLLQYYNQYNKEGKDIYIKRIICAIISKLLKSEFNSHFTKLCEANSINIEAVSNVLKAQIEESEDSYKQYIKSLIN